MRVFIKCKSPLLQKTLEGYLKDIKCSDTKLSDFYISDKKIRNKTTFLIGSDILHPFTKEQLFLKIKEFYENLKYGDIKTELSKTLQELKKEQSKKIKNIAKKLS